MRLPPDAIAVIYCRGQLDHAEALMGVQGLILKRLEGVDWWPPSGPPLYGFVKSKLIVSHVVWDAPSIQVLCDVLGVTPRGLSYLLDMTLSSVDAWLAGGTTPGRLAQVRLMTLLERLPKEDMSRFYAKLVAAHSPAG